MRLLSTIFVISILSGCGQTLSGTYHNGPAKNPHILTLHGNGNYELHQKFIDLTNESGRWWMIEDRIVLLLPNNKRDVHYAKVDRKGLLQLRLSEDLRTLLEAP